MSAPLIAVCVPVSRIVPDKLPVRPPTASDGNAEPVTNASAKTNAATARAKVRCASGKLCLMLYLS